MKDSGHSSIKKAFGAILLVITLTTGLAGCADAADRPDDGRALGSVATFSGRIPSFSGPRAAEFAQAYRKITGALAHQILAKGTITDQDYASISSVLAEAYKSTTSALVHRIGDPLGLGTGR